MFELLAFYMNSFNYSILKWFVLITIQRNIKLENCTSTLLNKIWIFSILLAFKTFQENLKILNLNEDEMNLICNIIDST